jgi:hypothetical protein
MRTLGLALAVGFLACGKPKDTGPAAEARERYETCQMYRLQAAELVRDARYGKIEPWKARGEANRIKDSMERLRCDTVVAEIAAALQGSASASAAPARSVARKATKHPKSAAKKRDARCEGLDDDVCASLAAPSHTDAGTTRPQAP